MRIPVEKFRRVVTDSDGETSALSRADADAILEIAYLTIASDRTLAEEELDAYGVIADEVRKLAGHTDGIDVSLLVEQFDGERTRDEAVARLRELGDTLASIRARQLAYKISIALATSDLAASDEEFEFEIDLMDALRLSGDTAEDLTAQVHDSLNVE
jgi:hypothetical protein